MSRSVDRSIAWRVFARSFLIQGSWNYHTMLGSGFGFAMLPALRDLFGRDTEAFDAALRRHVEHFNAHPYLSSVALGASVRMEADGVDPEVVRRFKLAARGPLGSLGDTLVWATWLPISSLAALSLYALGATPLVTVLVFLALYNVGHLALRVWGFRTGLRLGLDVGGKLAEVDLAGLTDRLRIPAAALIGVALTSLALSEGGVVAAGGIWVAAAVLAFAAGAKFGHRAWRPAAVVTVAAVAAGALLGWLP